MIIIIFIEGVDRIQMPTALSFRLAGTPRWEIRNVKRKWRKPMDRWEFQNKTSYTKTDYENFTDNISPQAQSPRLHSFLNVLLIIQQPSFR